MAKVLSKRWYFIKYPEAAERLRAAASLWLGTPFALHQSQRGVGVDCLHLPHALLSEACRLTYTLQADPRQARKAYPQADSLLLAALESEPRLASLPPNSLPAIGDLAVFGLSYIPHHLALVLDPPSFIHVMQTTGVSICRLQHPTFSNRLHRLFRLRASAK